MNKIISITIAILLMLSLSACKEEEKKLPELKTIEYWLAHDEEKMEFWLAECKNKTGDRDDNCTVIGAMHSKTEKGARQTYERVKNHREKSK